MSNSSIRNWGRIVLLAGAAMVAGAGCVATTGGGAAYREANQREDYELVQEKMRRLEGDIESLRIQIERLQQDLQRIQANSATSVEAQTAGLRSSLAALEEQVHALDARRATDRQDILDSVSKTVAKLFNEAAPVADSTRTGSPAPSGYGYEHIVESGETLSRIAQAYGTTVKAIQRANNLQDADTLKIGQRLIIPE